MTGRTEFDPREYWEERLRRNPGLAGVASQDYGRRYNEWLYRVRKRVFARTVHNSDLDLANVRVLDVGSGSGFYLDLWQRLGAIDLTGSDMTDEAVGRLKSQFRIPILQMDVTEPADAGPFDVVSIMDVLFHIIDDDRYRAAFRNLAALVRPGGVLLFSEHLPHDGTFRAPHRVSRRIDDVLDAARGAGFGSFVRKPMFVTMDHPIDPTRRRGQYRRWRLIQRLSKRENLGYAVGMLLYPVDVLLTRVLAESPSTEIVVCRRER